VRRYFIFATKKRRIYAALGVSQTPIFTKNRKEREQWRGSTKGCAIEIEKYTYNGEPAAYVKWGNKILGNLSAELARDLAGKYPNASYTAEILDISGGVCRHMAVI
jgi:hypothetical protein